MVEREQLVSMVRALQNGEDGAATAIYETFQSDIYYYIFKTVNDPHLAEDLTQDTFMEILETIDKLQEPAAFVTWSRQIAYHRCTGHFRKRRELLADEDADGYSVFDTIQEDRTEFIPDEALDKAELRRTIHAMIDGLPPEQRSAIMMRYFDELSVKDIAEIQGVSEGTVKSRLNYGRKVIKSSVEDYEKKNGIKLRCVGVVPLLLWLFREYRLANGISLTASGVGSATAVAAGAGTAVAAGAAAATGTGGAVAAGTGVAAKAGTAVAGHLVAKIVAGVAAAALVVGGAAVAVLSQPEETKPPYTTQAPSREEDPVFWVGYHAGNTQTEIRRIELVTEEMTDDTIRGHLQVSRVYEVLHETDFEGTGTARDDGTIQYTLVYEDPLVVEGFGQDYVYNEIDLIYDPEAGTLTFGERYDAVLRRVSEIPDDVLEEDGVWSGKGGCDFCGGLGEDHRYILRVDRMTQTTIRGTFTVLRDGETEHTSAFTGRGYTDGDLIRYEIDLETPRTEELGFSETTVDWFWLIYDTAGDTFHSGYYHVYQYTLARGELAPEPESGFWYGYGEDSAGTNVKRFELNVEEMTDDAIRGHLQVTHLYGVTHDSDFEGTLTVLEDGKRQYTVTFTVPAKMGTIPTYEYYEMPLTYDPETQTMTFDQWYYAELDRVTEDTQQTLLEENAVWSGIGEDDFCWPNPGNHSFRLEIYRMTDTTVTGRLTVSRGGAVEHDSEFTGRGYWSGDVFCIEVDLETARVEENILTQTLDCFWLKYNRAADTFTIGPLGAYYDVTMNRGEPEPEPEPSVPASEGLEYELNADGTAYTVTGIGACTDSVVVIPREWNGLPVTRIEGYAFQSCDSLTGITIGDTVTEIGGAAFQLCIRMTEVQIPESVTEIPFAVFNCCAFTEITLHAGVTKLGQAAFAACHDLTDIYYSGTMEQWNAIEKHDSWDDDTPAMTIHCSDGEIYTENSLVS